MSNPRVCMSCGADPDHDPPTREEPPIVAGALDAQAAAERKWWDAERENAALRDQLATLEAELAALRRVEREGLYVEREAGVDEPRCWYVADGDYGGRADTLSDALVAMDYDAKKEQR